jgi:cysteinyl-tRNA synthetase
MVNGQKMSKSLNNFITLKTLENKYKSSLWNVDWLKLVFLSTHYSAPIDITDEKFEMAKAVYDKFGNFFSVAHRTKSPTVAELWINLPVVKKLREDFLQAMNDDFNTPLVLSAFHEAIHEAWKLKDPVAIQGVANTLLKFGGLFGIFSQFTESALREVSLLPETLKIDAKIKERAEAKKTKNFKIADDIRDRLKKDLGVEIMDLKDGSSVWRKL